MVIQGIIAHPVHCLHDGSELEMPVFVHVLLTVANQSLGVDPHACFEPGPILQFANAATTQENTVLCLSDITQAEPVIHECLPKLSQDVLPL